jgi:hypothetical protein
MSSTVSSKVSPALLSHDMLKADIFDNKLHEANEIMETCQQAGRVKIREASGSLHDAKEEFDNLVKSELVDLKAQSILEDLKCYLDDVEQLHRDFFRLLKEQKEKIQSMA